MAQPKKITHSYLSKHMLRKGTGPFQGKMKVVTGSDDEIPEDGEYIDNEKKCWHVDKTIPVPSVPTKKQTQEEQNNDCYTFRTESNATWKEGKASSKQTQPKHKSNQSKEKSNQSGDESKQSGDESKQSWDDLKQSGDESKQSGDESKQSENKSTQSGEESEQSGDESKQSENKSTQSGEESEQSGDESKQSENESTQSGEESEQRGEVLKQSENESKQSGDKSKQSENESKQSWDKSKQSENESKQSGDESKQSENESKQIWDESKQRENESKQSEDESKQSGDESKQSEDESKQSGDESKQSENESKQSEDESKQSGDESKQSENESKQSEDESKQSGVNFKQTEKQGKSALGAILEPLSTKKEDTTNSKQTPRKPAQSGYESGISAKPAHPTDFKKENRAEDTLPAQPSSTRKESIRDRRILFERPEQNVSPLETNSGKTPVKNFPTKREHNDEHAPLITSLKCMPDDRIVLIDHKNKKLKLFSATYVFQMEREIPDGPYGVAPVSQEKVAVTTGTHIRLFIFGTKEVDECKEFFKLHNNCIGFEISFSKGTYAVLCDFLPKASTFSSIQVLDSNGKQIQTIDYKIFGQNACLTDSLVLLENRIFVLVQNETENKISCVAFSMTEAWVVWNLYVQRVPVAIGIGDDRLLLASRSRDDTESHIQQISLLDNHTIITEKDGLRSPRNLTFQELQKKVVVSEMHCTDIKVFESQNK